MKFRQPFMPVIFHKDTADGAAGTASSAYFWVAPVDCELYSAHVLPNDAIATDGTDYVTFSLEKADGAGGSDTTMCSVDTSATACADGVIREMTLSTTESALRLDKGDIVGFDIAKAGAGKVVPADTFIVALFKALKEV